MVSSEGGGGGGFKESGPLCVWGGGAGVRDIPWKSSLEKMKNALVIIF